MYLFRILTTPCTLWNLREFKTHWILIQYLEAKAHSPNFRTDCGGRYPEAHICHAPCKLGNCHVPSRLPKTVNLTPYLLPVSVAQLLFPLFPGRTLYFVARLKREYFKLYDIMILGKIQVYSAYLRKRIRATWKLFFPICRLSISINRDRYLDKSR